MAAPCIIVAEDDSDLRELIARALERSGFRVIECANGADLLVQIEPFLSGEGLDVQGVVTDIRMPGVTGLSVLEGIYALGGELPVFVMTAFGSPETHARATELGAVCVLDKPFDIAELVAIVTRTVRSNRDAC